MSFSSDVLAEVDRMARLLGEVKPPSNEKERRRWSSSIKAAAGSYGLHAGCELVHVASRTSSVNLDILAMGRPFAHRRGPRTEARRRLERNLARVALAVSSPTGLEDLQRQLEERSSTLPPEISSLLLTPIIEQLDCGYSRTAQIASRLLVDARVALGHRSLLGFASVGAANCHLEKLVHLRRRSGYERRHSLNDIRHAINGHGSRVVADAPNPGRQTGRPAPSSGYEFG